MTQSPKSAEKTVKRKKFIALGSFRDKRITESSGVVLAGPAGEGMPQKAIWTLNDSGGDPLLFHVSFEGHTLARLQISNAANRDWESMCQFTIDEQRFMAIGDVGDNSRRHKSCKIYVVREPVVEPKKSDDGKFKVQKLNTKADIIEFRYEDGAHNCEAISYNTEDNTFWFIEKVYVDDKRKAAPGIYVLPNPLASENEFGSDGKYIAKRVADFPVRSITGMAFSPDNQQLVIRNYFGAWLFEKLDGQTWLQTISQSKPKTISLPLQSQGEAICFGADGNTLLVTSEFAKAIIWQINLDVSTEKKTNKEK